MRPGVGAKLLYRKKLAGSQLDKEHDKIDTDMRNSLQVCCSWLLICYPRYNVKWSVLPLLFRKIYNLFFQFF